ncbi:MAG TPA: class I SAM-dependent methyltransferase [Polyangiaceae bacterium]|jgi:SAM-dependent methyltransferase
MRGRSIVELFRDRAGKAGLYDSPGYWDMKAEVYQGLARSNWPSNTFNRYWDERQMALVDRAFGDVSGLHIADVACGTGRASRHLAARGAKVTGLDFAPRALDAARTETRAAGLDIEFRVYDALTPPADDLVGRFDACVTISCLAMACSSAESFEKALGNVVSLLRPGGRFFCLEPIHTSRLLRRILRMSVGEWIERSRAHGLVLEARGGMGFVPARLLLAFKDWPEPVVRPLFRAGEQLLDLWSSLDPLSDYKWLLFRRAEGAHA